MDGGCRRHGELVAAALRDIPLLGSMPAHQTGLPERHLGLVLPSEIMDLECRLDELADKLELNECAWNDIAPLAASNAAPHDADSPLRPLRGKVVAIARDAAF